MPDIGPPDQRSKRGSFHAITKRVRANKEFFDRAWKVQVKCAAVFGTHIEETFLLLQKARREIEVSADMLVRDPEPQNRTPDNLLLWQSWRNNVWTITNDDAVTTKLKQFREDVELLCRPLVDREFKRSIRTVKI